MPANTIGSTAKQAWTPGPWKVDRSGAGLEIRGARIHAITILDHSAEANAKLIAKAPELFQALYDLHMAANNVPIELHERVERILREAGAL